MDHLRAGEQISSKGRSAWVDLQPAIHGSPTDIRTGLRTGGTGRVTRLSCCLPVIAPHAVLDLPLSPHQQVQSLDPARRQWALKRRAPAARGRVVSQTSPGLLQSVPCLAEPPTTHRRQQRVLEPSSRCRSAKARVQALPSSDKLNTYLGTPHQLLLVCTCCGAPPPGGTPSLAACTGAMGPAVLVGGALALWGGTPTAGGGTGPLAGALESDSCCTVCAGGFRPNDAEAVTGLPAVEAGIVAPAAPLATAGGSFPSGEGSGRAASFLSICVAAAISFTALYT